MGFFVPSALSLPCINSASLCRLSQLSQAAWPTALRLPAGGKPVRSPLGARGRGHASGSPPERGFPANDCNVDLAAVVAVLDHLDLAEHVADSDAAALNPRIADADATPEALSLAGAMEQARAVIAAGTTTGPRPVDTSRLPGPSPPGQARTARLQYRVRTHQRLDPRRKRGS